MGIFSSLLINHGCLGLSAGEKVTEDVNIRLWMLQERSNKLEKVIKKQK